MKKVMMFVMALFLMIPVFAEPAPAAVSPAQALCDEANKLLDANKFEDALKKLEEAEKLDPKCLDIFRYRGWTLMTQQKFEDAIKAYTKCTEIDPNFEKAYFNMANCYAQMKKYDDAIKCCDKTMELKGKLVNNACALKVSCLKAAGKAEDAKKVVEELKKVDPKMGAAVEAGLVEQDANAAYQAKDYAKAAALYAEAAKLNPESMNALYNGACSYGLAKDAANAAAFLENCFKFNKADAWKTLIKADGKMDADFDAVKDDPAFKKVLETYKQ